MMKLMRRRTPIMVGCQEMRKGNKTTMAGKKTKSIPYMIMKKMPDMKIKMPDMKIKMPDMRIQAGCGTLMFDAYRERSVLGLVCLEKWVRFSALHVIAS